MGIFLVRIYSPGMKRLSQLQTVSFAASVERMIECWVIPVLFV